MPDKPYSGVDNLEIMTGAIWYNSFLTREVLKYSGSFRCVLDFGAGVGVFSEALRKKGVEVICIESDKSLLENLRARGFEAYPDLIQIENGSIDYIFSLNVLEHIKDDFDALKALYRCLKPGGKLYLYVPAFNMLYSSMDRKVGHYRRYKMSSLVPLVEKVGFEVKNWYYVDSIGFLFSLLFRVIGNQRGDLNPIVIRIYDKVFFPLSRLLDLFSARILGKNMVVVATKPGDNDLQ